MSHVTNPTPLAIAPVRASGPPGTAVSTVSIDRLPSSSTASISNDTMASQQALVLTCLAVVKEHHNRNITLTQATIQFFSTLLGDNFGTKAFGTYVEQLAQTEHKCAVTAVQGSTRSALPSSNPRPLSLPLDSLCPQWSQLKTAQNECVPA